MTAWNARSFFRFAACVLLLVLCVQSKALARAGGVHVPLFSSERIDQLPPEVQGSVRHICGARPMAAEYFATYLENSRIIKLHFEDLSCEGRRTYREFDRCLREEFVRSGIHCRLLKTYFAPCGD
jgi:hypothetical protein